MDRRVFVAGLATTLAAPQLANAQEARRIARVGWISPSPGLLQRSAFLEAFRHGMRDRGWVEGQNLTIEARWGDRAQARELAANLVQSKVNVIVAQGVMVFAARDEAGAVPIVFAFSGDPVEAKLVSSLARPGGNLTGVSLLAFELVGKRLELLKETLPSLSRVAILANVAHPGEQAELRESQLAAQRLGLAVQYLPLRSVADVETAFDAIVRERAEAIVAFPDAFIMTQAGKIAEFSARRRIPAVSGWADFAIAGNFMSYGPELQEAWRGQVASYVNKILRGARPSELPVEQPRSFELVINLKTAKALGVTVPPSLLLRANRIIE